MKSRFTFDSNESSWAMDDHYEVLDLWLRGVHFFNHMARFMSDPRYDELMAAQFRSAAKSVMDAIARSRQSDSPASVAVWLSSAKDNAQHCLDLLSMAKKKGVDLSDEFMESMESEIRRLVREIDLCRDRVCWHLN